MLGRLTGDFTVKVSGIDESRMPGESVTALVERLSRGKARFVAGAGDNALVIGADQCAVLDGVIFGKPGGFERAREQLLMCAGREVVFHSGLCVLDARDGGEQFEDVTTRVRFRRLTPRQIENYLRHDEPWECAGSFRAESRAITLCTSIESADPSALQGLPLAALTRMLAHAGIDLLA